MRDPKRIASALEVLRQVWERHPDLRLGQLLVIGARPTEPCPELFNIEDQPLMDGLLHYQKQIDLSNSSPEEIVVCLGSECDSLLLKRLRNAVQTAGGSMSEVSWGVGGSQEVAVYEIVLPLGQLIATAETYVGLSLRGPVLLVNEITRAVSRA